MATLSTTVSVQSSFSDHRPVWARGRCRLSPPRFLAECCKRQLNQGSFVLLYFRLSTFSDLYWVCLSCLSIFSCTVLFVSISQVIDCEDRLRNDLYCVECGVKLYSNSKVLSHETEARCWYASRLRCQGWDQYILIYEPCAKTSFSSEAHTHTLEFNGPLSVTTRVSRYHKRHSPTHTHLVHKEAGKVITQITIMICILVQRHDWNSRF